MSDYNREQVISSLPLYYTFERCMFGTKVKWKEKMKRMQYILVLLHKRFSLSRLCGHDVVKCTRNMISNSSLR